MKVVELYSDGLKDDSKAQNPNDNNYNYDNQYYNDGRNNRYDTNNYNNYNRDNFGNNGYRNERLDSSFSTERSFGDNGLNESTKYEKFRVFESKRYGKVNLLFQVSKSLHVKTIFVL